MKSHRLLWRKVWSCDLKCATHYFSFLFAPFPPELGRQMVIPVAPFVNRWDFGKLRVLLWWSSCYSSPLLLNSQKSDFIWRKMSHCSLSHWLLQILLNKTHIHSWLHAQYTFAVSLVSTKITFSLVASRERLGNTRTNCASKHNWRCTKNEPRLCCACLSCHGRRRS